MSAAQNAQVDVNSGRETTDSFPLKGEDYEDVLPAPLCRDASTVLSKSPSDEYRTMNKRRRFYSRRKRGKTLFGLKNAVSQRQSDWNGSENQVYQLKRSASTSSDVSQRFLLRPSRRIFKLFSLKRRGANLPHRFRRFGKTHIPQQSSTEFQHRSELFRGLASKPFENDLKAFQPILPDSPLATSSCTSLTSGMKKPCDRGLLTAHTRSRSPGRSLFSKRTMFFRFKSPETQQQQQRFLSAQSYAGHDLSCEIPGVDKRVICSNELIRKDVKRHSQRDSVSSSSPIFNLFHQKRLRQRGQVWPPFQLRPVHHSAAERTEVVENIPSSLKQHTALIGAAPVAMTPPITTDEFVTVARDFGLDANAIARWCSQGIQCWITFEFPSDQLLRSLNAVYPASSSAEPLQTPQEPPHMDVLTPHGVTSPYFATLSNEQHSSTSSSFEGGSYSNCDQDDSANDVLSAVKPNASLSNHFSSSNSAAFSSAAKHTLDAYRTSRTIPGGARFWDETGRCWLSRKYTLIVHPATGSITISRWLPRRFNAHPRRGSWASVPQDSLATEKNKDLNALSTTSKDWDTTFPPLGAKALCLRQLDTASRLCCMTLPRSLRKALVGALRCVRIARAAAQLSAGRRSVTVPTASIPTHRIILGHMRRFVRQIFPTRKARPVERFLPPAHPSVSLSDESGTAESATAETAVASTLVPTRPLIQGPISQSNQVTSKNHRHLRHGHHHHTTRDEDILREFEFTSVGLFFCHKPLPLIVVFDDPYQASEFIRILSFLLYIMKLPN